MKLDSLTSRARYLALVLPGFALFSTVHSGCIRGPSGYGHYGVYGYGNRSSSLTQDGVEQEEGECVVYTGEGGQGSFRHGDCNEGDVRDGYGSTGHDDHDGHGSE